MNAEAAKQLTIASKASAITEAYNFLQVLIEIKAKKGWTKLEMHTDCPEIYKTYDGAVLMDAFGKLREDGFRVNMISHTVFWN